MRGRRPQREIVELAGRLGLEHAGDALQAIITFCRNRVGQWLAEAGPVDSIQQLEALVCRRLGLAIEEVFSDQELAQLVQRYIADGEPVFASLPVLCDEAASATLIRRRPVACNGPDRFVAVIDCRGAKAHRRFFSRWHEIAHLLTLDAPTAAHPVHRSTHRPSAVERLMDAIAGELGFFEPLFRPVLASEAGAAERLDFALLERVRSRFAPQASYQATALAVLKRWPKPAAYVEAGLALTRAEAFSFEAEPVPARRPTPKLRVLSVVGNEAARSAGFQRLRHLQVPATSVLHRVFFSRQASASGAGLSATEDLSSWHHSNGQPLDACGIRVEARPARDRIQTLLHAC